MNKIRYVYHNKELMHKIMLTLGILLLFRVGCALPVPFVESGILHSIFNGEGLLTYFNMIGGGALEKSALFALGVSPYINASIIIQLLCVAIPALERTQKEDPKQIQKMMQWLALALSAFMSVGYYMMLRNYDALKYTTGVSGTLTGIVIVLLFMAGAQMVLWLGWQIDDHGIGNGVSMMIFAGIVSRWSDVTTVFRLMDVTYAVKDYFRFAILILIPAAALLSVFFVTKVNDAETRVPVVYSQSAHSRFAGGHSSSYIPIKLIMSGVMPIIFASTMVSIPMTIGSFLSAEKHGALRTALMSFNNSSWLYCLAYIALIFAFNYFYIEIQFDGIQMANNLRAGGGSIPGIRPGKPTSDYLNKAANRTAPLGAFVLSLIAALPIILGNLTGLPIQLGGTSLLIVCGVALETVAAVDSYLTVRSHTGFLAD